MQIPWHHIDGHSYHQQVDDFDGVQQVSSLPNCRHPAQCFLNGLGKAGGETQSPVPAFANRYALPEPVALRPALHTHHIDMLALPVGDSVVSDSMHPRGYTCLATGL